MKTFSPRMNTDRHEFGRPARLHRSADFPVCCIAGFLTCGALQYPARSKFSEPADLEIGDTADSEVCATFVSVRLHPRFDFDS